MKGLRIQVARSVVATAVTLGLAATAGAQDRTAGEVTTLQGTAQVQRVSTTAPAPAPQELKFRDKVQYQDRITTGDRSLARILLRGKAVVTVRERSVLTITETLTTSTVDISSGKIALTVAKERLAPGERIDIKTPNAIAGVRGTIVITEVDSPAGGTPATTRFALLSGLLEVALLDPVTGRPGATLLTLNPLQALTLVGFTPPSGGPQTITPAQAQAAANDYKVNLKDAPPGTNAGITDQQVEQATTVAASVASGAGPGGATSIINQTNNPPHPQDPRAYLPTSCSVNCGPSGTNPITPVVTTPPSSGGGGECSVSICEGRGSGPAAVRRR